MWNVWVLVLTICNSHHIKVHSLCSSVGQSEGLLIPRSSVRARSQAEWCICHYFALLAQLVARGSDKAKVIGSSPVESMYFYMSDFLSVFFHIWNEFWYSPFHGRCVEDENRMLNGGQILVNCKFKLIKKLNLNLNLYREIPRNSNPIKISIRIVRYRDIWFSRFWLVDWNLPRIQDFDYHLIQHFESRPSRNGL